METGDPIVADDGSSAVEPVRKRERSLTDLYFLAERQAWQVRNLDFSIDADDWVALSRFPILRKHFLSAWSQFFLGEQAVTDTLAQIMYAAPTEDDRLFLATQVADESRHTLFFRRFLGEVCAPEFEALRHQSNVEEAGSGYALLFNQVLRDAVEAVRRDPADYASWIAAVTVYHLVIEGMVALTGQRFILQMLRRLQIMPGFQRGFRAISRDESRHVYYGLRAVKTGVNAGQGDAVAHAMGLALVPACRAILPPEQEIPFVTPARVPRRLRVNHLEMVDFSLRSLRRSVTAVGLSGTLRDEVIADGRGHYSKAASDYESRFGKEHPLRWWERQTASLDIEALRDRSD